ncbi:MAG: glycosyltransferase family 4 protein [Bacteroidetes bacterium]|nr:glycosyltransferase family 4 protein [Bacteroidota bacterium]
MTSKAIWVINQFAGHTNSGWGERHFLFSKYWIENGFDVTIISGSFNHVFKNYPHAPFKYNYEIIEKRKFCWVKVPKYKAESAKRFWSMLVFAFRCIGLKKNELGKPDVIIVSSMPIFPILSALILKIKYKKVKILFEIRDLWPESLIQIKEISKIHPLVLFFRLFEWIGYKYSDRIITLLPNSIEYFKKFNIKSNKISIIPNGIDINLKNEELNKELVNKLTNQKFKIIYTGTIGYPNCIELLVKSAELLKNNTDIHFYIVGDGHQKENCIKLAKDLTNITFIDKVPKSYVQSILKFADVCFIGWRELGLYKHGVSANKYFDYMLAAKPILDSNNLIKDPVELSGCGLIVKPDSAEAIANGIIELYSLGDEKLKEMGQKGREFVSKNHNIKHLASLYSELFG